MSNINRRNVNKYRNAWDRIVDKWGDEAHRQKAWRNADASLIPEYVAPKRNLRSGTRDRINRDLNQLQQQMTDRRKNIKRA